MILSELILAKIELKEYHFVLMALKRENPRFFNLVCQLPFYPFGGKHWLVHTAQELDGSHCRIDKLHC
ncbi:hypothetical protein MTR_6g092155 [Medicago truncatula]|uniref:Uncharacterized protein n=1 Tax=Medicago truncatula TaxID=3880 RepID=A0A072UCA1_MEDTR|nr:hypothetical protein MTR_6g092155 [Medicago truncatula]